MTTTRLSKYELPLDLETIATQIIDRAGFRKNYEKAKNNIKRFMDDECRVWDENSIELPLWNNRRVVTKGKDGIWYVEYQVGQDSIWEMKEFRKYILK